MEPHRGNDMRCLPLILLLCCFSAPRAEVSSPHGPIKLECARCHATTGWTLRADTPFDHGTDTSWPLEGVHELVSCGVCHIDNRFTGTGSSCVDCHLDLHQGGLGTECRDCHSPQRWIDRSLFERRHDRSLFPLTGRHRDLTCDQCHSGDGAAQFLSTPRDCAACHARDWSGSLSPNHAEGGLGMACASCHTTERWSGPGAFAHDGYPLLGRHAGGLVTCAQCHQGSRFNAAPSACEGCHATDWQGAASPSHPAAGFSQACASCHSEAGWRPSSFSHTASTGYELTGAHVAVTCAQCHEGEQYQGTAQDCSGCHLADFQATTDPAHEAQGYPADCTICHTTEAWEESDFDHQATAFPLVEAHVTVVCADCHLGGNFTTTPADCWSCHESSFIESTEPAHQGGLFPQDCTICHDQTDWEQSTLDHNTTLFPLGGAHLEVACADCHTNGLFQDNPTDCWSCHEQVYSESDQPAHAAGLFPQDCAICHTDVAWTPSSLDHDATLFPLTGAHVSVSCADCHTNGVFLNNPTDCWSCHEQVYNESDQPPHAAGLFPQDCTTCHATTAWQPSTLDHDLTAFPLTGAHVTVSCASCHVNGQFQGNPTACWGCHEPEYQGATNPNHVDNQFPQDCTVCHTTAAWQPATFDHALTDFPLTGAHIQVSCAQCHVNGQYAGTPSTCWACHQDDYENVDDPNHVTGGYSHDCTECHTTDSWEGGDFNHDNSDFPLTGAHVTVSCATCHINGQYQGLPSACWACHQPDYQGATNPDHADNQFPQDCAVCHTTAAWQPSTFDHALTDFPLTGEHVETSCAQCHVNGQYAGTPSACWACHQDDYEDVDDPNHVTGGYSHDCTECHTTDGWEGGNFNHDNSDFPLTGAHVAVSCAQCHVNGQYQSLPSACWACHEPDFNGAVAPNHVQSQYPQDCTVCHSTAAWQPSTFDHALSAFPLTGAHVTVSCATCHVNGQFQGLPSACWACHEPDYNGAVAPNHVQSQYPQDCATCHSTTAWQPSTFDHALSAFPLSGAHVTVSCAACHVGGQFQGTPADCWSCHADDFQSVADPNHVSGQYPHDCMVCHTTATWQGAIFNHNTTDFPLTGAHVAVSCAACHVGGQYQNTPMDCFFCHDNDYNSASSPDHGGEGYPTTCVMCHTTSAGWNSNWNHAGYFPIYSGQHRDEWTTCASCHLNNELSDFSCTHCHEHRQSAMDSEHDGESGYVWESHACLGCHPDGSQFRGPAIRWKSIDLRRKEPLR